MKRRRSMASMSGYSSTLSIAARMVPSDARVASVSDYSSSSRRAPAPRARSRPPASARSPSRLASGAGDRAICARSNRRRGGRPPARRLAAPHSPAHSGRARARASKRSGRGSRRSRARGRPSRRPLPAPSSSCAGGGVVEQDPSVAVAHQHGEGELGHQRRQAVPLLLQTRRRPRRSARRHRSSRCERSASPVHRGELAQRGRRRGGQAQVGRFAVAIRGVAACTVRVT